MEIDIVQILFQVINFGALFVLFQMFLYKPILKVLDDRAEKIKEGLESAEKNVKLQHQLEANQEELLAEAKKEAQQIRREAKKEAEETLLKAKDQAKADARATLEKERQAFEAQMAKEVSQFKDKVAKIVGDATTAVLKGSLDKKAHQQIIDNQIKSLDLAQFN